MSTIREIRDERINHLIAYGCNLKKSDFEGISLDVIEDMSRLVPALAVNEKGQAGLYQWLFNQPEPWLVDTEAMAARFKVSINTAQKAKVAADTLKNDWNVHLPGMCFGRAKDVIRLEITRHLLGLPVPSDPKRHIPPPRSKRGPRGGVGRTKSPKPDKTLKLAARIGIVLDDGTVQHVE